MYESKLFKKYEYLMRDGYYKGYINQDMERHGEGDLDYSVGGSFKGFWKWNKPYGLGFLIEPNGDFYEGEVKLGKKHGEGRFTKSTGCTYEG